MRLLRTQNGFTLVEVMLALGITAVIASILGSAILRVLDITATSNNRVKVVSDLQIAGQWLNRDGDMAQTTDLIDAAPAVSSMSLNWISQGVPHTSTYSLSGTELQRTHNGSVITVARNISDVEFSIQGRLVTVALTSQPGGGGFSKQAIYHLFIQPVE